MIIKLKNDNLDFSYIINKNPDSGPRIIDCRKGNLIGWFTDPQTYYISFMEGHDESSFGGSDFEYLDVNKFNNPFIINKMIDGMLDGLNTKYDDISDISLEISNVNVRDSTFQSIKKYFHEFIIQDYPSENWTNYRCIKIRSYKHTLEYFLKFVQVVAFYMALDQDAIYKDDNINKKYFQLISDIDAPYFIRYLFKQNLLRNSEKKFYEYQELINNSEKYELNMSPKNNWESRFDYINSLIPEDSTIIDFGSGEGRYLTRLAKNHKNYICVDIDPDCQIKCSKKIENNGIDNASVVSSIDEIDKQTVNGCTIIMSEVIEHIELDKHAEIFKGLLSLKPSQILITTPNKEFNPFYGIELRHEDHKFEFTLKQLSNQIINIFGQNKEISITGIGDTVNNIPTTWGVCINNI